MHKFRIFKRLIIATPTLTHPGVCSSLVSRPFILDGGSEGVSGGLFGLISEGDRVFGAGVKELEELYGVVCMETFF